MQGQAAWRALAFRALLVLLAMMFGAFLGLGATAMGQESYTARADVFVTAEGEGTVTDAAEAAAFSQSQATNFAELVTRDVVLRPVINRLHLDMTTSQLREEVNATVPLDTSIVSIAASDASAERSAAIANAVAASLTKAVDDLTVSSADAAPLALHSIEQATVPSAPTSPRPFLNVAIGILAGLCLAVTLIALFDAVAPTGLRRTSTDSAG
jgi:capsular polysaccharide biosynthesis protein